MKTKLIIIITVFIFLQSCKRDNDNVTCGGKTINRNLQVMYKQNITYNGISDTLHLVDSNNNSLYFIAQGIDSGYNCIKYQSNPNCLDDNVCNQYYRYKFKEVNNKAFFQINSYLKNEPILISELLNISFSNKVFSFAHSDFLDINTPFKYLQRVFNNKIYNDVHYTYTIDRLDTMFYNQQYGVIAILNHDTINWFRN